MPRVSILKREVTSLKAVGWQRKEEHYPWNWNRSYESSLVTPAVEEDRSSVGDALQDASSFSYSDSSSGSSSTISQQLENYEHQEIHGHRLIYMPSLCSAIEECTTCRLCGAEVTEELFKGFLVFVEVELENLKRKQDWISNWITILLLSLQRTVSGEGI